MIETIPLIAGKVLDRGIDLAGAQISNWKQRREIKRLIEDTISRASTTTSSVNLTNKFKNDVLVTELVSHHSLQDITRDEAISTFLGEDADDEARQFVRQFYDKLTRITAIANESFAERRAADNTDEILAKIKNIESDANAQYALLEEIVKTIQNGQYGIEGIRALSRSGIIAPSIAFFKAYYALCTDADIDYSSMNQFKGNDTLVEALCSVAFSARRIQDISKLSEFFPSTAQACCTQ